MNELVIKPVQLVRMEIRDAAWSVVRELGYANLTVAPPMEPEMHYTRTFLFAAEVVHRSWAVYFLFILSYIHKLFSTFITLVGHNRSIHQF